jgi:hypothetical protein
VDVDIFPETFPAGRRRREGRGGVFDRRGSFNATAVTRKNGHQQNEQTGEKRGHIESA